MWWCRWLYQGKDPRKNAAHPDGAEAIRVSWPVLHGLEVRLRKRVAVGNGRAALRLDRAANVPNARQPLEWSIRNALAILMREYLDHNRQ